jgi:hypothetical protein
MQLTKMSITRALTTLKNQKQEIAEYFGTGFTFLGYGFGTDGKTTCYTGLTKDEVASKIQGNKDKIDGLIARQVKLKDAINASNQVTMIKIGGREVSVAEAILIKATLPLREQRLQALRQSATKVSKDFRTAQTNFDKTVEDYAKQSQSDTMTAEEKAAVLEATRATQIKLVGPYLIDPLKINDLVEKEAEEINFLKNELDYVLSESNTTTMIEVEI